MSNPARLLKGHAASCVALTALALIVAALVVPFYPARSVEEKSLDCSRITQNDIKQFAAVHPYLLRGGAPSPEGMCKLKELGVSTIIDLRPKSAKTEVEEHFAKSLGLEYLNFPQNDSLPTLEKIDDFYSAVRRVEKSPSGGAVFVHCQGGMDRTGTMIGMWRIRHDGWSVGSTLKEMLEHGWFIHRFAPPEKSTATKSHGQDPAVAAMPHQG